MMTEDWPFSKRLRADPEDYFRWEGPSNEWFTRDASRMICMMAAERGFQMLGLEGGSRGPYGVTPDSRTFWSRNRVDIDRVAETNLQGVDSIDEDPEVIDAYLLTAARA
ncbi:hypothetical protein ACSBOB_16985 [Mesorhizobium sp. ASY16-5R]|uniref:hypothetical protein n=1 Tax=Mesorhizobium sp. ASY16-5R TaxID=3445772 RepID=UPI003F9EFFB8